MRQCVSPQRCTASPRCMWSCSVSTMLISSELTSGRCATQASSQAPLPPEVALLTTLWRCTSCAPHPHSSIHRLQRCRVPDLTSHTPCVTSVVAVRCTDVLIVNSYMADCMKLDGLRGSYWQPSGIACHFHKVSFRHGSVGVQAAVLGKDYVCPIHPDTPLPMMYMPDCLRATWQLITAPREELTRCTYNVTAMSFTPAQLEASIRNCYPGFKVRASIFTSLLSIVL